MPLPNAQEHRLEWALLILIGIVCAVLSVLQYRWSAQAAHAEHQRLKAGLSEQVQRMAQAFDDEVRAACAALLPRAHELRDAPAFEAVHSARYEAWSEDADTGLFERIGIVRPAARNAGVELHLLDASGRAHRAPWPAHWESLKTAMEGRVRGEGLRPSIDPATTLIEIPVFAEPNDGANAELEWMIFEVSRIYVKDRLMPGLVSKFLNPEGEAVYAAAATSGDGSTVYGSLPPGSPDASAGFFPVNFGLAARGDGRGRGRGRDRGPPGRMEQRRWTLSAWHQLSGSLDEAVAQTRRRNLMLSLLLTASLAASAILLVRYTARTRRLARMQMDFVAGISHDLRTPLSAIRGAAYNLSKQMVTEPKSVSRYGDLILRNSEELTGMIDNILAFSASSQAPVKRENIALAGLVARARNSVQSELDAAGAQIETDIPAGLPEVAGDPLALERALRNLIENAARHAGEGKWIGVSARSAGNMLEVHVRDRGPGIPPGEQARIFEPFYRGEQSRRRHIRGTGLGLRLVKDTVERHGGSIHVSNLEAGGAEFIIRLPEAAQQ